MAETIYVDRATGSNTLIPLLEEKGLSVEPAHLKWADVEFVGRGVKGEPVLIGIECKRITELTGDWERFAGEQVTKMNREYAHRYLVFEGEWQQNKKGVLLQRRGRMSFKPLHGDANASRLRKKLITMEMCGGFHVHHVHAHGRNGSWSNETVRYLVDLYRWWTDDDMDQHKSHIVNYQPQGLIPLNKYEHAIAAWPGLSSKKAKPIARRFKNSIKRIASASVEDLAEIEVADDKGVKRRIGTKLAEQLTKFLQGED